MRISNKVKRNISLGLVIVGIVCVAGRGWEVIINPRSGMAWFEFAGMVLLTYICFDNFRIYNRLIKKGILFGSKSSDEA